MMKFSNEDLSQLWEAKNDSDGEDNGQVTIIGGSRLFHGAPIFALKAASRSVDMVFFGSPDPELGKIALKAQLNSFIWVPWDEIDEYVAKSEAILIGPGLMRFHSEKVKHEARYSSCDEECKKTTEITKYFLTRFRDKKWVIDGGSLQVLDKTWIPKNSILTPNKKEFEHLFNVQFSIDNFQKIAKAHSCVIVYKGPVAYVTDGNEVFEVTGGNAGLTKGGTGDTLAGVILGLAAKNPPLLAAVAGTYILKKTAENLYDQVGYDFNADDLANSVYVVKKELMKSRGAVI